MVYTCKLCKKAVLKVYDTDDGVHTGVCGICKAKYEHEVEVAEVKKNEPSEIAKLNKRIDNMAKMFSGSNKRFGEIETKNGDLQKRIENLEDWVANLDDKINHGGSNEV